MFNRTIIYSLAAAATVAVASVATASIADARPGHGGPGFSRGGGMPGVARIHVRPAFTGRHVHLRPSRIHVRPGIHLRPRLTIRPGRCHINPWLCRPIVVRPPYCLRHPWRCPRPIPTVVRYPVYPVATPVAAVPVVAPVAAPVRGPCTCLRKTYLPNGAVLFEDICTNESAVNPPQQAAEAPQQ